MPDVIVVGGGAAGCVMARRLADAGRDVLLLEAGPDRRGDLPDSLRDGWSLDRETLDWGFMSEPDGVHDARRVWRKKVLGGTGWFTRFTPRGHPGDYAAWDEGWSWNEVLPYFRRLESDADFGREPWHGDSGPLPSRRYFERELSRETQGAIEALTAHGHGWVDDHNRPGAVGVGRMPMNTVDGRRVTTADAYLAEAPPNLTVRADATVDRVVLDQTRATGVRLADGATLEAGGVVLCAGVYGSPAVLLRSGVEVTGVGQNLGDHPGFYLDLGCEGPAANPVLHTITSLRNSEAPADGPPDLMYWIADPDGDPAEFGVEVVLMKPRSRGSVQLRSADPGDPPLIRLPNLEDGSDVRRLMEGYRHALEVFGRPPEDDDAELEAKIRAEAYSIPHVVGTCALGSVVDADGRVHGTEGLWVADASIIPEPPSGFVHFPTVMVAERLSERIDSLL
jgi:choline dehydrogenase-like flavoprotein